MRLREGVEGDAFPDVIEKFLHDGLLERSGARVRLTPRGVLLSKGLALRKWVMICFSSSLNRVACGPKKVQPDGRQM